MKNKKSVKPKILIENIKRMKEVEAAWSCKQLGPQTEGCTETGRQF